jgi:hypothetical protein
MTEADYIRALELLKECEQHLRRAAPDFAYLCVLEALKLFGEDDEI